MALVIGERGLGVVEVGEWRAVRALRRHPAGRTAAGWTAKGSGVVAELGDGRVLAAGDPGVRRPGPEHQGGPTP
jgi:hypothetical protein